MRTLLSVVCIISASITAGNCIMCVECSNNNGLDCYGDLVTCGACLTVLKEERYGSENITYSVKKTCDLSSSAWNYTYSLSSENFTTSYMSFSCDTDLCNNQTAQVIPRNNTENGIVCPSCQTTDAESCVANGTIPCTGSETRCLMFTGQYVLQGRCQACAFQGCVTNSVCEQTDNILERPESSICGNSTLHCSDSRSTTPIALMVP